MLNLMGCATAPYVAAPPVVQPGVPGIYHRVVQGQTLWRISKIYNTDLDEIAAINHISDTSNIETGQLIFIPNQKKQLSSVEAFDDDFIWPIRGKVITGFGQVFNNMVNKGINIQPNNPNNDFNVVASRSGKVVFYADNLGPFGKTIIMQHGDNLTTVYSRISQVFIKPGDNIAKGAVIAKIGSDERNRNAYLHFEVRKGHVSRNPNFYLP